MERGVFLGILMIGFLVIILTSIQQTSGATTCLSNWTCAEWSKCFEGNETRTCTDLNNCQIKRVETFSCTCSQKWECTDWSPCIDNSQIRTCIDTNLCEGDVGKPPEKQVCGSTCKPDWQCDEWQPKECSPDDTRTRTCTDINQCGSVEGKPAEINSCKKPVDFSWVVIFIILIILILIIGTLLLLRQKIKRNKRLSQVQ